MDLWIRNQNKKQLLLINTIALAEDETGLLLGYGIDGKIKTALGKYETDERALEILDDIQNVINAKTIIQFQRLVPDERIEQIKNAIDKNSIIELPEYKIKQLAGVIVYEMPEE